MDDPWTRWTDEEPPTDAPARVAAGSRASEGTVLRPSPAPVGGPIRALGIHPPELPRLLVVGQRESQRELGGVLRVWGYEPVACESIVEARTLLRRESIDAALIDVDLSPTAYDLVWQLNELDRPCRSVLIGRGIDADTMREAFLVGVAACLAKPIAAELLGQALRVAVEGSALARACLSPASSWRRPPETPSVADKLAVLTLREQEVLDQLLAGASTKSMAASLGITPRTVKYHVTNILTKLGEESRMSLLARLRTELARQRR